MRKDIALAQELAARLGLRIPSTEAAGGVLDDAIGNGLADADIAAVIDLLGPASQNDDSTEEQ